MKRIIFLLAITSVSMQAIAQEVKVEHRRYIKVLGHAEQNFEPTYVDVQIHMQDRDKVNSDNDIAKKERDLLEFLKANGINENNLRVQNINTGEAFAVFGSRYYINKNYTLRIDDLKRYETIILGLVEKGFKNLYITEIGMNDKPKKQDEVMAAAVKNGTNKANIIATAANVKNLRLLSVDETMMDNGPSPVMYKMAAADMGATNIPLGKINIQKQLVMIYEIE
jgi:uncharacterized protein YggE